MTARGATDGYEADGLPSGSGFRFGPKGRVVALVVVAAAGWIALSSLEPPDEVTGAAQGFSLDRAKADVDAIAGEPRPTGSDGHARAREYIIEQIRAAGLDPEVQEAVVPAGRPPGIHRLTRVRNVFTRLPGTGKGDAVMLAAHYDSVPAAPGAGDDAAGVATLLETMRVLAAEGPLPRDIIFLFTDAEELGLHGARAFVDAGLADDVDWVLNFEARGAAVASLMFETMPGDTEAMRFFARTSPKPSASSYSYDIYSRMPNDTDFTVFREVVPAGFNFGFIEDPAAYHSAADTPARLEGGSLRHHGVQALALARGLSESPPDRQGRRSVYFSLPGYGLVVYPAAVDRAVAVACALLGLSVLLVGLGRGRLSPGRLALGLLVVVAAIAVAALALMGLKWLWTGPMGLAGATKGVMVALACSWLFIAAGLVLTVVMPFLRQLGVLQIAAAAALLWTLLAVAGAWLLGSSAFLFTWPVLFTWVGLFLAVTAGNRTGIWRAPVVLACAFPAILIWVPTLKGVAVALGPAAMILGIAAALPVLLLGLQASQLAGSGPGRWWLPGAALLTGTLAFGWAAATAGPAPGHPQGDSLLYVLDSDNGKAYWASYDDAPDEWTRRVLGGEPERRPLRAFFTDDLELMTAPAEALPLEPPMINVRENEVMAQGGRRLKLELRSSRGAPFLEVEVKPEGELLGAAADGQALEVTGAFILTYHAAPEEGIDLELELAGDREVRVSVVDGTFGLPEAIGPGKRPARFEPRRYPWNVRDRKFPFSDTTLVRTERRITAGSPDGPPSR